MNLSLYPPLVLLDSVLLALSSVNGWVGLTSIEYCCRGPPCVCSHARELLHEALGVEVGNLLT
jgi:hypothetical protein